MCVATRVCSPPSGAAAGGAPAPTTNFNAKRVSVRRRVPRRHAPLLSSVPQCFTLLSTAALLQAVPSSMMPPRTSRCVLPALLACLSVMVATVPLGPFMFQNMANSSLHVRHCNYNLFAVPTYTGNLVDYNWTLIPGKCARFWPPRTTRTACLAYVFACLRARGGARRGGSAYVSNGGSKLRVPPCPSFPSPPQPSTVPRTQCPSNL